MRTDRSARKFIYLAPAAFLAIFFSPRLFAGNSSPRPIASLTAEERMTLPGETQVTVHNGRTTTLAVLRKEHELRMERFRNAAALGRALAANLKKPVAAADASAKTQPPPPPVQEKSAATFPVIPQGSGIQVRDASHKVGNTPTGGNSAVPVPTPPLPPKGYFNPKALTQPLLVDMVPNPFPVKAPSVPIDYAQACASPTTLCFYVPQGYLTVDIKMGVVYADDYDPLIRDQVICKNNGGSQWGSNGADFGCVFSYPLGNIVQFTPKGKLSMTGPCDSPFQAVLDPRGALQVMYPNEANFQPAQNISVPNTITCALQVWMSL